MGVNSPYLAQPRAGFWGMYNEILDVTSTEILALSEARDCSPQAVISGLVDEAIDSSRLPAHTDGETIVDSICQELGLPYRRES